MKKTAALLAASAVAVSGFAIATNPAQADGIENEKTKRCSAGSFAQLSLEKEFGRIDVDFDIENASPRGVWMTPLRALPSVAAIWKENFWLIARP